MKISSLETARAGQVGPVSGSSATATLAPANSGGAPAASLQLSPKAQALSAAKAEASSYVSTVNAIPDREDKIQELKASINAGTYKVSSSDIADQILRRMQADKIQ